MENLLVKLLKEAVNNCYEKDSTLIERSMEQASVARIFYYMQDLINTKNEYAQFKEYNLDSEYNKNCDDIKKTTSRRKGTRPDIILHKRNKQDENLIVVEFKSNDGNIEEENGVPIDVIKLQDYTRDSEYSYKLGVWVKLCLDKPHIRYYQNGREVTIEVSNG